MDAKVVNASTIWFSSREMFKAYYFEFVDHLHFSFMVKDHLGVPS